MTTHKGGRPRVPIEQRRLEGTLKPSRHGRGVTLAARIASLEAVKPPRHFRTKELREAWLELVEPLLGAGVLTEADLGALEMMVVSLVEFRQAQKIVRDEGLFVDRIFSVSKDGDPIYRTEPNQALKLRDNAAKEFRSWAARFGLTPADRASLGLANVQGRTMLHSLEDRIGRSPRARKSGLDNGAEIV